MGSIGAVRVLVFMTTQQFILKAAIGVYLVILVATAYFTRATARRVAGALMGGLVVGIVGVVVEILAHAMGWWRYPSKTRDNRANRG
jgi:uncharacterized membrane protein YoaT (DUF817 family)